MQRKNACPQLPLSLSLLALSTMARNVWIIATNKLPKQIDPKDVVVARTKLPPIAGEQHDEASSGTNHHVDTTPAITT